MATAGGRDVTLGFRSGGIFLTFHVTERNGGGWIVPALEDFLPADCEDDTRIVAAYWLSIHKSDGSLPGRQEFDPLDLPGRLWANLVLSDVTREPFDIRYRFVGTTIVELDGFDATGMTVAEVPLRRGLEDVLADYRVAVSERRPHFRRVVLFDKQKGFDFPVERLHLPMARNGRDVDMILTSFLVGNLAA